MIKNIKYLFLFIASVSIFAANANAQYFLMQDSTCIADIQVSGKEFDQESIDEMNETLKNEMKDKGFKLNFKNNKSESNKLNDGKVLPGQLYFSVRLSRKGYLFKQCTAHVQLKRAKNYRIKKSDETLYEGSSTRQFPRVTFQGDERCVRAIQDAFIHIPNCRTTASD